MEKTEKKKISVYKLVFVAVMAAVVCVVTLFRFPLLGSKVHFANAMCLLAGLLFGPVSGGIAAGLGSALYDALFGGYEIVEVLITFVSKFAMAWVCAMIVRGREDRHWVVVLSCVAGALSYVALYMLKTFIKGLIYTPDAVWVNMGSKLPASLINAVFAMLVAPVLYAAILPPLKKAGVTDKL